MSASSPTYDKDNAASSGRPLDAVVFAQLMAPFEPFEDRPKLAVAVSGGADSMALALLAHEWCRARGGEILAITVDHGLRAEAADEARWVGEQLAGHGIAHRVLRWMNDKPASAVQQKARDARYVLLDRALAQSGCLHLLVAHHLDDQRETIAMRTARDSKVLGRAGMSARRFLRNGRVLRPLLPVPKADLIATVKARGQDWAEDPSNRNRQFERVRVRQDAACRLPDGGQDRLKAEAEIAALLASSVTLSRFGIATLNWTAWQDMHRSENAIYALGQVMRCVGGAIYMPAHDKIADCIALLSQKGTVRQSLGGCILHKRRDRVFVCREVGRMDRKPVRLSDATGERRAFLCWDNRFELTVFGGDRPLPADLFVAPLGVCDVFHSRTFRAALGGIVPIIRNLPRAALASMPALYHKGTLLSVGGLEVLELSDVLSAAGCDPSWGRDEIVTDVQWQFAPPAPLWESGFKLLSKPGALLA